jgi:hypothetical protein
MNETNHRYSGDDAGDALPPFLEAAVKSVREQPLPAASVERALKRAREIASSSETHRAADPVPFLSTPRGLQWRRFAMRPMAAAAAILLAATLLYLATRPQSAWADMARSMLTQDWIHVVERSPADEPLELWLSPRHQIKAVRIGRRVQLFDHRLKIAYSYEPAENTLYKMPDDDPRTPDDLELFVDAIPNLLRAGSYTSNDDKLAFLGSERDGAKVVSEKLETARDGQKSWSELTLTVQHPQLAEPVQMIVRADPITQLPHSWAIQGQVNGKRMAREVTFEYPSTGPTDAYALGVPDQAIFVDRVPADDVARLVDAIAAARQRFDNYHAIVVESAASNQWYEGSPVQIWRKGTRWRMEFSVVHPIDPSIVPSDHDEFGWWRARVASVRSYPVQLCDGDSEYSVRGHFIEAENPLDRRFEIESMKRQPIIGSKSDATPSIWSRMPEFLSHPPLGIPRTDLEPTVDLNPTDGPPSTVLLRTRRTFVTRGNEQSGLADFHRYWIDRARSHVVLRWETSGPADASATYVTEDLAQSPQGHWFPTVVRLKNAIRNEDGTTEDSLLRFYVDFDTEIPDKMFVVDR